MKVKVWLAAAVLGSVAAVAVAQSAPEGRPGFGSGGPGMGMGMGMGGPMMGEMAMFGPGMMGMDGGHGGHGGPGHRGHGGREVSPERVDARIDRMAERLVQSVYGTPEQTQKIAAIGKKAAADLRDMRKQRVDMRAKSAELLKAPTIDRAAIEALRAQQVAMHDAASKRMSIAMADVAEVLTPEQRVKLAERWQKRGEHRGEHRGHGGPRGERPAQDAAPAPRS